jgi:LacI family transcriptional regulator
MVHDPALRSRATIGDVARAAGVSTRTVTRVSLGQPHVGAETRRRTEAAIRNLQYRADSLAQGLAWRRSDLIGMIYENPNPNYIIDVQQGLLEGLQPQRLELVVRRCEQADSEFFNELAAFAERLKLAGMVLTPPLSHDARIAALLEAIGCPYVRIAARRLDRPERTVAGGDRAGAREMGRHLAGLGHRRIGAILGPANFMSSGERLAGLQDGLAEHGVRLSPGLCVRGAYTFESGIAGGRALLAREAAPSAIFAANDEMAAGVLQAARQAGLAVPDDLTVVGFDDLEIARSLWPPLTSVRMPTRQLGRLAAWKLSVAAGRKPLVGGPPPVDAPRLVVRRSCGPPPVS